MPRRPLAARLAGSTSARSDGVPRVDLAPARKRRRRADVPWNDHYRSLLGKIPDSELAQRMGTTRLYVSIERKRQGLAASKPWKMAEWTPAMLQRLGTASDMSLAREWGVSGNLVGWKRQELNIPAFGGPRPSITISWTDDMVRDLGRLSLRAFAKAHHVPAYLVQVERRRRGIAPAKPRGTGIPEDLQALLGTMSDRDFAERFGYDLNFVGGFRVRNAIPSFRERQQAFPWTPYRIKCLGKFSDHQLARRWGIAWWTVWEKRDALGIRARFSRSTWTQEMLRELPALTPAAAAAKFGLSIHQILKKRKAIGLYRGAPRRFTPADDALLGTMSDAQVARQLGMLPASVSQRRRLLGITVWTKKTSNRRK